MTKKIMPHSLPESFVERLEFANLTQQEKDAIYKRAEEHVLKEIKTREEERFFDHAKRRAHQKLLPDQEQQDVLIDLPGHAAHILIDGVQYLHGFTYRMQKVQAETVRENMQRAWNHEDDVGGANRSFYHQPSGRTRPRGITLTRAHSGMAAKQIHGTR